MAKGGKQKPSGFTIIEVLIVLAVSGLLLVSAIIMISGHQDKTEFKVAINGLYQQIQQVINETGSGYYPNQGNFSCKPDPVTHVPQISTLTRTQQGQNAGCVFLGKVLEFGLGSGGFTQKYAIYPMVGDQAGTAIKGSWNSGGAQPQPIKQLETYQAMQYGLSVSAMAYPAINGTQTGAVGFLAGANDQYGTYAQKGSSGLNSSSLQLSLYAVGNTTITSSESDVQSALSQGNGQSLVSVPSVAVCFASGTTDKSGLITIGNNSGLSVTLKIYSGKTCTQPL